ncbi:type III polyketide synthase, partial [Streptomyces sp. NPDC055509]
MTMRVLSVRGTLPEHCHRQEEITESVTTTLVGNTVDRGVVERFHRNVGVETRHTVLPLEEYGRIEDFGQSNDVFI